MKRAISSVVAASLAALAAPAALSPVAAQNAVSEIRLSPAVREPADQARQAIVQNNLPAASGYLSQASAAARTDGERYVVAVLQLDVANRTFDRNGQIMALNALLTNPYVSQEDQAEFYYHRGRLAFNAQDNAAARSALREAINRGSTRARTYLALADLEAQGGNNAEALQLFDRAAELQQQADAGISEFWLRRAIDIANRLNDAARVAQLSQMLVAAHPNPRNWRDVLSFYRTVASPDPQATLDLWRLQAAAGALAGEADYRAYLRLANTAGQPGEIQRAVQTGRAANMLDGGNAEIATILRTADRAATTALARLDARATAARAAATGTEAMAVADACLGFARYAEAAALYRTAIEKGGVDTELANLRLGMALALAGDAAGARAALDTVNGTRAWVARFWRTYVDVTPAAPQASAGG